MSRVVYTVGPEGWGVYEADILADRVDLQPVEGRPDTILCPGFVDIHIHGAFGIDFMSASPEEMKSLAQQLGDCGYEAFAATTVTADCHEVKSALSNLPRHPMILGFHLEGPFISPAYPGAQPKEAILDFPKTDSQWDEVLDDERLRVITLAPEKPGAKELIQRLSSRGVRVSMGHTNASYLEADAGFEAGALHATHTFNAMRGFHHREAGMAGYCMSNDQLFCELIYDRIHVSQESAALLIKTKPVDKIIAVSDSTKGTGMKVGEEIEMWGQMVVKTEFGIRLKQSKALAGSCITLLDAFRNLASDFGPEKAIRFCSLNPRQAMGMTGQPQVWSEFSQDFELRAVHRIGTPALG